MTEKTRLQENEIPWLLWDIILDLVASSTCWVKGNYIWVLNSHHLQYTFHDNVLILIATWNNCINKININIKQINDKSLENVSILHIILIDIFNVCDKKIICTLNTNMYILPVSCYSFKALIEAFWNVVASTIHLKKNVYHGYGKTHGVTCKELNTFHSELHNKI